MPRWFCFLLCYLCYLLFNFHLSCYLPVNVKGFSSKRYIPQIYRIRLRSRGLCYPTYFTRHHEISVVTILRGVIVVNCESLYMPNRLTWIRLAGIFWLRKAHGQSQRPFGAGGRLSRARKRLGMTWKAESVIWLNAEWRKKKAIRIFLQKPR